MSAPIVVEYTDEHGLHERRVIPRGYEAAEAGMKASRGWA